MARYRMTPARRAALRKAQAASARKRRGSGKGRTKAPRSYKSQRRRQRAKVAGGVALLLAAHGASGYAKHVSTGKRTARAHSRNKARNEALIRKHTGTKPSTVLRGARAHGGGPNRSNRVFVTSKYGTTSVRRRHH